MFRRMFERLGTANFRTMRAIQFSPEPTLDPEWFASFELSIYGAENSIDIQAIDRPDGAYDLVACSHVLEHVADDRKALGELLRITAPDGFLYLAVPDPFREEKTRDWGFAKPEKHGHFRVYGADIAHRFARYLPGQAVLATFWRRPGDRRARRLFPAREIGRYAAPIEAWLTPGLRALLRTGGEFPELIRRTAISH